MKRAQGGERRGGLHIGGERRLGINPHVAASVQGIYAQGVCKADLQKVHSSATFNVTVCSHSSGGK